MNINYYEKAKPDFVPLSAVPPRKIAPVSNLSAQTTFSRSEDLPKLFLKLLELRV
jgi:hypothetical protein